MQSLSNGSDALNNNFNNPKTMLDIFSKRGSGLRFCHFNARSLKPKIDEVRLMFSPNNTDVVCISETWLNDLIDDNMIAIPGYKVFRNDRRGKRGGGVAIFVKESISSRVIQVSTSSDVEFIFVEIGNHNKCLVGCIYRPPGNNTFTNLENVLESLSPKYKHVILGGDFNANLLITNAFSNALLQCCSSFGLNIINKQPTHFTHTSSSLLDLLIVSDIKSVLFMNQICGIADHDILYMIYDIPTENVNDRVSVSYFDYKNVNMDLLVAEIVSLPWSQVYCMTCVNKQLEHINSWINYLHGKYVPLKSRTIRRNCPWFSNRIASVISERQFLYNAYKKNRTDANKKRYKDCRNKVTSIIREAKANYIKSKLKPELSTSQLWKNVNEICVGKVKPNCRINPNTLNAHFTKSQTTNTRRADSELLSGSLEDGFSFRCVDEMEILTAFKFIKSKAVGLDLISPKFIDMVLPFILPFLKHLFNSCLTTSTFPSLWKVAKIVPIAKNSSPNSEVDYRPISILPFLSKVLEKLMFSQMIEFIERKKLLTALQSGFRRHHSCTTAILNIVDDMRMAIDKDYLTILTLLDFSRAFDCVNHDILLKKLAINFNFSPLATKFIQSYLCDRSQKVCTDIGSSDMINLQNGVPQGSILGPLLFSLFINDLPSVVKSGTMHLYADDAQFYASCPLGLIEDCVARVNEDLDAISAWASKNRLLINASKSQCMIVYRTLLETSCFPPITLNSSVIPYTNRVKNLGIIINNTLSWNDHVDLVIARTYACLRTLWPTAHCTPLRVRRMLIKSLVLPIIFYGDIIFAGMNAGSLRKLELAFNACTRYVYGLRKYDHISAYRTLLLGCNLANYFQFRSCMFVFNLIRSGRPEYLASRIKFLTSNRSLDLAVPTHTVQCSRHSFFVQGVRTWNAIPILIRKSNTVGSFKTGLLKFLQSNNLNLAI